jgi:hypothetical protein
MITINLLPEELRPIKRTPLPHMITSAVFVGAVLFCGMVFMNNRSEINTMDRSLAQNNQALQDLQAVVDESNALTEKKVGLNDQVQTINEIASDRIIWSRQLYNLGRLAPENLWYDTVQVNTRRFPVTKTVYNPTTKVNEKKTDMVDKQVLVVKGYVVPGKDGKSSISPFTLSTESDEEFSNLFQFYDSSFQDTSFDTHDVREFEVEFLINRGGNSHE